MNIIDLGLIYGMDWDDSGRPHHPHDDDERRVPRDPFYGDTLRREEGSAESCERRPD